MHLLLKILGLSDQSASSCIWTAFTQCCRLVYCLGNARALRYLPRPSRLGEALTISRVMIGRHPCLRMLRKSALGFVRLGIFHLQENLSWDIACACACDESISTQFCAGLPKMRSIDISRFSGALSKVSGRL